MDDEPRVEKQERDLKRLLAELPGILEEVNKKYNKILDEEYLQQRFTLREDGLIHTFLETPTALEIHMGTWKSNNEGTANSVTESYRRLFEELHLLAEEIKNNRAYRNVDEILAFSWMVTRHPD